MVFAAALVPCAAASPCNLYQHPHCCLLACAPPHIRNTIAAAVPLTSGCTHMPAPNPCRQYPLLAGGLEVGAEALAEVQPAAAHALLRTHAWPWPQQRACPGLCPYTRMQSTAARGCPGLPCVQPERFPCSSRTATYWSTLPGPQELLGLPAGEAEARAAEYIELWGFKNTYALGKHLAEKAVVAHAAKRGVPLAIVRPSLVSAVGAEPYPGYSGALPCMTHAWQSD